MPSILTLTLLPFMPESPRWLICQERFDEALELLTVLHAGGDREDPRVRAVFGEICDVLACEKRSGNDWLALVRPGELDFSFEFK